MDEMKTWTIDIVFGRIVCGEVMCSKDFKRRQVFNFDTEKREKFKKYDKLWF